MITFLKFKNKFDKEKDIFICTCGKEKAIGRSKVKYGHVKSCGCKKSELLRKSNVVDITNKKFNLLTAIEYIGNKGTIKRLHDVWEFKCDCGNIKKSYKHQVISGNIKSCGCLMIINAKNQAKNNIVSPEERKVTLLIKRYKNNAKRSNNNFDLTKEDFSKFINMNCHYCGIEPYLIVKDQTNLCREMKYNGIDRIDNNVGYTLKNCVTCCEQCNRSKLDYSENEFKNWIKRVYNNIYGVK